MRWIAATLLGLLALAYALIALAAPSAAVRPAPDDQGQGGLSSLTAALRAAGYRVAFDRSSRPRLAKDDVVVTPVLPKDEDMEGFGVPKEVVRFVAEGGRAFALGVPKEIQPVGRTLAVRDIRGRRAKVDDTQTSEFAPPEGQLAGASDWTGDERILSQLVQVGKGRIARLDDGALATNRFLARNDNARVVLSTLATVARPGDRLVFVAEGYGEAENLGPIEAIGPWAVGALWQSLAVLAAYGAARGIRFGLPAPEVRVRRGARELLDALAGHYRRGRRTDAPLAAAARERPDDYEAQAIAARAKVPEAEARRILMEIEARPRSRR